MTLVLMLMAVAPGFALDQVLTLKPGWNAVSLWLSPDDNDPSAVFAPISTRIQGVYGYDGNTGVWSWYLPAGTSNAPPNTLTEIDPLNGYWVQITTGSVVNLPVAGSIQPLPARNLQPGWHFIGFGNAEPVFWADVLPVQAQSLRGFYVHDAAKNGFCGFSSLDCDTNHNGVVDSFEIGASPGADLGAMSKVFGGSAYWIKTDTALVIEPFMEVESESDLNAFPPGATTNLWFEPGYDTDLDGDGQLDYGYTILGAVDPYGNPILNTQTTIWFRVDTGAAYSNIIIAATDLTIKNLGGGGVLQFAIDENLNWLYVDPPAGQVLPLSAGATVTLKADMSGLEVGEYSGTIGVLSSHTGKVYQVKMTVPPLDGRYGGSITITNIDGKAAFLSDWPVLISIDSLAGSAVLHAEESTQFSSNLVLTGSIPGKDFNLTGMLDVSAGDAFNPYGIAYQRSIQLVGGRGNPPPGQAAGSQIGLDGSYAETLSGLPGGTVQMTGFFSLVPVTDWSTFNE